MQEYKDDTNTQNLLHALEEQVASVSLAPSTLYIVGTPIGNLADISVRALATLAQADLILAEDTRSSQLLLSQYGIRAKYLSNHKFNEEERVESLLEHLASGKSLALVSDAGMPGISDPGSIAVKAARENGYPVLVVPGPSAFVVAIANSGFPVEDFRFMGFLANKGKEREEALLEIQASKNYTVLYEAPHRIVKSLVDFLAKGFGQRKIHVARELTKRYEELIQGSVEEVLAHFRENVPRGEFVLLLEGQSTLEVAKMDTAKEEASELLILSMLKDGASNKEIVALVQERYGLAKNKAKRMIEEMKKRSDS